MCSTSSGVHVTTPGGGGLEDTLPVIYMTLRWDTSAHFSILEISLLSLVWSHSISQPLAKPGDVEAGFRGGPRKEKRTCGKNRSALGWGEQLLKDLLHPLFLQGSHHV